MRNLLALLALLVLAFATIGWYQDWYHIRGVPAPDGQQSLTVDINTRKIGQDLNKAEASIQHKLEEKARAARAEAARQDKTPPVTKPTAAPVVDFGVLTD